MSVGLSTVMEKRNHHRAPADISALWKSTFTYSYVSALLVVYITPYIKSLMIDKGEKNVFNDDG